MPRVQFEELELDPRLADLLEMLLDGYSLERMALARNSSSKTIRSNMSRLTSRLLETLDMQWERCVALEWMRQQEAIIRSRTPIRPELSDAEIDRRLAVFAAHDRAETKAMAARA